MTPIAYIYNDFGEKFGLPRQSGMAKRLISKIVMEPPYDNPDAFRGIERYDRLWLLWEFDKMGGGAFSPTVRPPRLGGNERLGVFATRSPNRPNRIGMTVAELLSIGLEGRKTVLTVSGADIRSGTAIWDIKPYLPYADSYPASRCDIPSGRERLKVEWQCAPPEWLGEQRLLALEEVLALDPRPAYHDSPDKLYGMSYGMYQVHFKVARDTVHIINITVQEHDEKKYSGK